MKVIVALLIMLALTICYDSLSYAEMRLSKYKAIEKEADSIALFYIAGAGAGIAAYNSVVDKKLYCQPIKLALEAENYRNILNQRLTKMTEKQIAVDPPIEIILLYGLIDVFPCKDK